MALPKRPPSSTHDLKQRVITCLNKLSDRDTHTMATAELEQIVKSLTHDSFSSFLSCLYDTDSSEKPPVRKQCVRLLGLLSSTHGESLSPHLSKMLSNIIKRLRDSDSVVRSACVDSVTLMSTQIVDTSTSLVVFLKPLMETLMIEQDINSQMGSALCLSSVIEASHDPEPAQLQRVLAKLVKLLKCESFKAKPALLSLIRSIIGVGGSTNGKVLGNLISCLVEFLSSEDWAARKGAAEAFVKLALVQRHVLWEFKSSCLSSFETRRFDKVKVVRDSMNQMIDAWKDVPGASDEDLQSKSSSIDNTNSECSPSSSVSSNTVSYTSPQTKRTTLRRSSFPPSKSSSATSVNRRSPLKNANRISTSSPLQKLDHKKPSEWKIHVSLPQTPSIGLHSEDNYQERNDEVHEPETNKKVHYEEMNESNQHMRPERQGNVFSKNNDEKLHKFGKLRTGSRVVPYDDECLESTTTNDSEHYGYLKESEDMSLIQKQLLQIESQQSSLLDLLQKFMGSSQNGIRSLETRVNGLEMALDEIMYDMTVSSGRVSPNDLPENTCCKLPGADFLSPKFWRKSEGRCSSSRYSPTQSTPSLRNIDGGAELSKLENRRYYHHSGSGGFSVNPLAAEIHNGSRRNSEAYSDRMTTSIYEGSERRQVRNGNGV